jgi:hypothetical protein
MRKPIDQEVPSARRQPADLDSDSSNVRFVPIVLKNSVLGSVWMLDQAGDCGREEKQLGGR